MTGKTRIPWSCLVAGAILFLTGLSGLWRFPGELDASETTLQRATEVGVLVYGAAGVAAAVGLAMGRRWSVRAAALWAVAFTWTGALAPVAFGGPAVPWWTALAAGGVTALVAAGVVALAVRGSRPRAG